MPTRYRYPQFCLRLKLQNGVQVDVTFSEEQTAALRAQLNETVDPLSVVQHSGDR